MNWMMTQKIRYLFFFCFCPFILWSQSPAPLGIFDPIFSYSTADLQTIRSLPTPKQVLLQKQLEQWDPILYDLTNEPLPDGGTTRLLVYLYVAQREFALLSYHISQQWVGNPDFLIVKVIQLFYPSFQSPKTITKDLYSEKIGHLVFQRIEDRFKREEANLKDYPLKEGPYYWKEQPPLLGQRIGTCQPWLLRSVKDVRSSPPPDPQSIIWTYGLNQIRFDQARLTPEQRQLILYWGGQEGPESGNWFAIVNRTLQKKSLSLEEFLFIRAILAMGYTDALIAVFDSKYTYLVLRPHMRDPNIVQVIKCPKHPSYPSAHSVASAAVVLILSHFFPDEKSKWQKLAIEAVNTRIWAGLHYMYDNEQGLIQGEKVGKIVIENLAPIQK